MLPDQNSALTVYGCRLWADAQQSIGCRRAVIEVEQSAGPEREAHISYDAEGWQHLTAALRTTPIHVLTTPPSWAEAVFHVLAHLPAHGLPSSLYAPWYVQFAESELGAASQRLLAEDVAVLGALLRDHDALVAAQNIAWLWRESAKALVCAERELPTLTDADVDDAQALEPVHVRAYAVEGLRSAAVLEAPSVAALPVPDLDASALVDALTTLLPCAPALAHFRVAPLRPLTRYGRTRGRSIFVGVPGAGVSLDHVAMQAAYQATLGEVLSLESPLAPRRARVVSLLLLNVRCADAESAESYRAWCHQSQVPRDSLDKSQLSRAESAVLEVCLRS